MKRSCPWQYRSFVLSPVDLLRTFSESQRPVRYTHSPSEGELRSFEFQTSTSQTSRVVSKQPESSCSGSVGIFFLGLRSFRGSLSILLDSSKGTSSWRFVGLHLSAHSRIRRLTSTKHKHQTSMPAKGGDKKGAKGADKKVEKEAPADSKKGGKKGGKK